MGRDNVVFRTSVSGFNKKDVYNYLETINKDIQKQADNYEKRISSLEAKNKKLEAELTACEENKKQQTAMISELENDISEKDKLIEELDIAAVKLSVELDTLSKQYSMLVTKYEQAFDQAENADELRRKADAYDRIIARAKEKQHNRSKAPDITSTSPLKTEKDDIENILSGSTKEILEHIKEAQQKFSEAIENAQKESDMLKERVNTVMNSSKEKILSQIN